MQQSLEDKELLSANSLSTLTSTTSTTEYYSAISSDDDEFFDLPEDAAGAETPTNENILHNSTNELIEKALERLELVEDFVHYMSTIEAAWGDVHFVISDMFLTFFR